MTLSVGARIGSYEITGPLGEGGMGVVYRARDTKLNRDVALKMLPSEFALDPDRLARFKREALMLAALDHPNIGAIYGIEDSDDVHALVLQLVDGPTLADRIARGPIPIDEALPIARQITEALEAAHEQGIIHRDLKPANIKARDDGTVKVLDFGLAKLAETPVSSGSRPSGLSFAANQSPTITTPAMTMAGVILGTAAYMSPEQAKGREADKRSDIWAFGCVLYEMLTGKRAFDGDDVAETLASVLKGEVDWAALPSDTPPQVFLLIRGCLARNRQQRIADVSAIRFALSPELSVRRTAGVRTSAWTTIRLALIAAALLATAAVAALLGYRWHPSTAGPLSRFEIGIAPAQFSAFGRHVIAIAPDGSRIAYVANNALYLRAVDSLEPVQVRGSGSARFAREPFFSPDSRWLGFWQDGRFRRVSVNGGTPTDIAEADIPFGASWEADNTIVYGDAQRGIFRVSADGGRPELIVESRGGLVHGPHLLPDSRTIIFTLARAETGLWDDAEVVAESLNTHERTVLLHGATDARYLPTGHLVYVSGKSLFAAAFDPRSLKTGSPVRLLEGVGQSTGQSGAAQFAVSASGILAYVPESAASRTGLSSSLLSTNIPNSTLALVDHSGRARDLKAPAQPYMFPRMSPDGTQIAVAVADEKNHISIWHLARESLTSFTVGTERQTYPVFTPDGKRIVFTGAAPFQNQLFSQAVDGTGQAERVTPAENTRSQLATSFTPDGSRVIFTEPSEGTLWSASMDGSGREEKLVAESNRRLENAMVSPDGRWLAYEAGLEGRIDIVVRPFPDVSSGRQPVSSAGGSQPTWSPDSKELYYVDPSGAMMRVPVPVGTAWTSPPMKLFDGAFRWSVPGVIGRQYDVTRDGKFVMLKPVAEPDVQVRAAKIVVVQNWLSELQRLVPTK